MAIKPDAEYPGKTVPGDANYPQGSAQDVTTPGDGTGTPLQEAWINDIWGVLQKLLTVAAVVPSGNPDTILASDYFDSMNRIFQRLRMYNDTGAAGAYVLTTVFGTGIPAYSEGHEILFKAANSNPGGASTAAVDGGAVVDVVLPTGAALPANSIASGQYVRAVYRAASGDYELLTQTVATLSDHNKAVHDALGINAAELGGNAAALYALLASPSFTGNPTAPTQAPGNNTTRLATTAFVAAATGAGAIGQTQLKTASGTVSNATATPTNLVLPGGEYGFYPQIEDAPASTGNSSVAQVLASENIGSGYVTYVGLTYASAKQRYVQSSPPYKIGDIPWGHFLFQLRNKATGEAVCTYEAQDPPWAYNGPNWLHKNDSELLALIPHPFPAFGTEAFPDTDFEVVLVDLRDFDVIKWQRDNEPKGKTLITDLGDFAAIGGIKTRQQVGLPEILGFTDKIKIRARNN